MIKHWTDKELAQELSKLTVISDTREQVNDHVTGYFDKAKVPYITRKLDTGDYSAQIDDMSLERSVVIERKHNLDELCQNMTADRDRFEREFIRAKAYGIRVYLIIEEASWDDIFLGNYRSKLTPKSLSSSLMAWIARYDVNVIFTDKRNTGKLIHGILYYYARETLLYGSNNV